MTATVVALLLIVTYRSPVLWLVPLLVIAFADRVGAVVGTAVASGFGLSPDGSTSGITSVLVFGAGTNSALLLISRYREELGRTEQHREALVVAVRAAASAIVASNATVVLALLTLLFASAPSNPQPRRAGRIWSGGRRDLRAGRVAATARAVRQAACSGRSSSRSAPRR